MKTFLYSLLGFVLASAIAWGGLLLWAAIYLDKSDSYWDRTPYAADVFFACWLMFAIATAIAAAWLSRRNRRFSS